MGFVWGIGLFAATVVVVYWSGLLLGSWMLIAPLIDAAPLFAAACGVLVVTTLLSSLFSSRWLFLFSFQFFLIVAIGHGIVRSDYANAPARHAINMLKHEKVFTFA
jgi:hypothetical protein